ncbi:large ribosomal subunit protein mL51 [Alligator mississippiensis]|uniref:Large ribosomal subunit protein mL51 n=1 Tax=Alligator mississippiensis TaxID=8496 RepID=A0A151MCQ5_ALLMI|nr:large ribosomal subunit protein mL51 [Alligator mississippiensis]KYO22284.1 39S ribosomal protein L51, mitochondrial [Alligator mississippiensis]
MLRAARALLWGRGPTAALAVSTNSLLRPRVREPPAHVQVDRWTEKRALFGVYDNVGILGNFQAHPKDLIRGPKWLRGWRGNELQRCIRKKKMVGDRMFDQDYKNLVKRIRFLYRRYNHTKLRH